jgi:hypothetical protein
MMNTTLIPVSGKQTIVVPFGSLFGIQIQRLQDLLYIGSVLHPKAIGLYGTGPIVCFNGLLHEY